MKSLNYAATGSMLLAVMALIAAPQAGADDCKYYMESVNAETGEAIRWTRQKTLRLLQNTDHHGGYFMFLQEGDSRYLVLDVWSPYRYDEDRPTKDVFDNWASISVGDKLLLLMADESIIELQASQDSQADVRMVPPQTLYNREPKYQMQANWSARYEVSPADAAAIAAQMLSDVRMETSRGNVDFTAGRKPTNNLQEIVACVL